MAAAFAKIVFFLPWNPDLGPLGNLLGESDVSLGQLSIVRKDFLGLTKQELHAFACH
jgi:hypothetical protein